MNISTEKKQLGHPDFHNLPLKRKLTPQAAKLVEEKLNCINLGVFMSTKMRSSLHGVNKISAAAKVSVIGALELSLR